MSQPTAFPPARTPRSLILGTAFLLALFVSLAPRLPPANAQDARITPSPAAPAGTPEPAAPAAPAEPGKAAVEAGKHSISIKIGTTSGKDAVKAAADKNDDSADEDEPDPPGTITIKKNGKTVKVTGLPPDREFDSVGEFMHKEPALAAGVVVIVAVVFLAPVLAIGLILWYRFRKSRMLNETMLKLAEKGVVAPADALEAIAYGKTTPSRGDAVARPAGGLIMLSEQARDVRRRAAWSDLRKGVVMGATGLAITLYSIFEDRSPNVVGLVLLFVGAGYIVLWWFEERQMAPVARTNGGPLTGGSRSDDTGPGGAV